MPAYRPSEVWFIAPNLVVADDTSIDPIRTVVPGETYKIFVQNFPARSKVEIKLLQSLQMDGPTVATIASFDDDGTAEVAWTAPTDVDVSVSKYYLQAQPMDFPALFAFSQLLSFKDLSAPKKTNIWMYNLKESLKVE
jgi:hypothetical protein